MRIIISFLIMLSLTLLWSVNWKIAVGVLLFGWAMNLENMK